MTIKHTNPTRPRIDRSGKQTWARAPYNFVPPASTIVHLEKPLCFDTFNDGLTGWFECTLETKSPTYIRGMLTQKQFEKFEKMAEKNQDLSAEDKESLAPFFSFNAEKIEGFARPVLPGSSLRGMIRSVLEVITFSRLRWVTARPTFTFRAVAAPGDDPLREPYNQIIGAYGKNVRAGVLKKDGDRWLILPARKPSELRMSEQGFYLKVKSHAISSRDLPGYHHFDDPAYQPGYFKVSFSTEERRGKRGAYTAVTKIGQPDMNLGHQGMLVCSGSMLETQAERNSAQRSPRKNHALIIEPAPHTRPIPIPSAVVEDYLNGLTEFQKSLKGWDGEHGVLKDGAPVFYVEERGQVICFGHSPNFRVPARHADADHSTTPRDFLPHLADKEVDLSDAIFGWVEDDSSPSGQNAGRVFFGDAQFDSASQGVWYKPVAITPHVLASPKPTTFQHYLAQDASKGHNPDKKQTLAHYGTPKDETQVRGHKFYWIKGEDPDIEASVKERKHLSQLTCIVPLKPGVRFNFKIHFENLRDYELGALCWALDLPENHCHRLGMGKPYGMGAVTLSCKLYLTDRKARYSGLFSEKGWMTAEKPASLRDYKQRFEDTLLDHLSPEDRPDQTSSLTDLPRIRDLLTLMSWRDGTPQWKDWTRYMEIEHGSEGINEYKERPVLPDPQGVIDLSQGKTPRNWFAGDSQSSTPSRQAAHVSSNGEMPKPEASASQETKPEKPRPPVEAVVGAQLKAVMDYEDDGNIYLDFVEIARENIVGRILKANRGTLNFKEGNQLTVEILSILSEPNEQVADCIPLKTRESVKTRESGGTHQGTVESFGLGGKPYGYIHPDDGGKNVFVHINQVEGGVALMAGQRVQYRLVYSKKGQPTAQEVRLVQ